MSKSSIYAAGVKAYSTKGTRPIPASTDAVLRAVAAMLYESRKPATKKKATAPKLPFSPQELYEACLARVPHIIACEPYDTRWFGRLGKELQSTNGLTRGDLEAFLALVESGGLDFFENMTFAHVIKHWGTWVVKARAASGGAAGAAGPEEFID